VAIMGGCCRIGPAQMEKMAEMIQSK